MLQVTLIITPRFYLLMFPCWEYLVEMVFRCYGKVLYFANDSPDFCFEKTMKYTELENWLFRDRVFLGEDLRVGLYDATACISKLFESSKRHLCGRILRAATEWFRRSREGQYSRHLFRYWGSFWLSQTRYWSWGHAHHCFECCHLEPIDVRLDYCLEGKEYCRYLVDGIFYRCLWGCLQNSLGESSPVLITQFFHSKENYPLSNPARFL